MRQLQKLRSVIFGFIQCSLQLQVTTRPLIQNSKHLIYNFSLVLGCVGDHRCDRQLLLAQVAKFATQKHWKKEEARTWRCSEELVSAGRFTWENFLGTCFMILVRLCVQRVESINSQVISNLQFCSFKHLCLKIHLSVTNHLSHLSHFTCFAVWFKTICFILNK